MNYPETHVKDKVVVITGVSGELCALVGKRVAMLGGIPVMAAREENLVKQATTDLKADGFNAAYYVFDNRDSKQAKALIDFAVDTYGRVDTLVNAAMTMPLAFFSEHTQAAEKWDECIDVCLKGSTNCISAVYDQMIAQGKGQIINLTSTYANLPASGSAVFQAAAAGLTYLSTSLRDECHGKIKVTTIKTSLMEKAVKDSIIDPETLKKSYIDTGVVANLNENIQVRPDLSDINSITYYNADLQVLADNIVFCIDQPWGINISEITVRVSGDQQIF